MDRSGGLFIKLSAVICCVLHITFAKLLPYGIQHGDEELVYDSSQVESRRLDLFFPTPLLGGGLISELYINSVGTLSYAKLQNSKLDQLTSNIVLAPFMADVGAGGKIFYRQTENDIQVMSLVSTLLSVQGITFTPMLVVVVTWQNMPSPDDATKMNTYQAIFTTSGEKTYFIINYDGRITWTSSSLSANSYAGVFVAGDLLERCGWPLKNSGTDQIWTVAETSTESSVRGQHILDITNATECYSFESPCGEPPKFGRTEVVPMFENSNDNILGWSFFVELSCKKGLEVSPGVSTQRVHCLYEPDYYEYAWDFEIKECMDLGATRKFTVAISNIIIDMVETTDVEVIKDKLFPEIMKMLAAAGITDVVINIDSVSRAGKTFKSGSLEDDAYYGGMPFAPSNMMADDAYGEPDFKQGAPIEIDLGWDVKFTIFSPTYANKELTPATLQTSIITLLEEGEFLKADGIAVEEETDKCLQDCICFIREGSGKNCKKGTKAIPLRPDACCGGCGGKPYASSKKVCCNGRNLYDPSKAVCCPDGRIRVGKVCPS